MNDQINPQDQQAGAQQPASPLPPSSATQASDTTQAAPAGAPYNPPPPPPPGSVPQDAQQNAGQYYPPQNPQQPPFQGAQSMPVAPKDRIAAGLLGIFLGSLGIHKFYLGYSTAGVIMLVITLVGGIFTFGLASAVMGIIGIIEAVIYLTKTQQEFENTYVYNKREWF